MFVDEAKVFFSSGKGGDGAVSFHREKYRPKGGPDGGDGGRGGSIILRADAGTSSLSALRDAPHRRAKDGGRGAKNNRTGPDADDLSIQVPVGTVVKDEEGHTLADLAREGDEFVVARGGRGGRGNAAFVASERRVPGFAELGEPGEEKWVRLELRSIADAAVIGLPNVGKSSLVAALSAARPKVADYPFTTLEPSLGVVEVDDLRFTVCDIPGLIAGAHEGRGLGLKFLRHAERAPVFIHLVDAGSNDPVHDHATVRAELVAFKPEMAERPEIVCVSRADLFTEDDVSRVVDGLASVGTAAMVISSTTGVGLEELKRRAAETIGAERASRKASEGFELFRTPQDRLTVAREDDAWRVESASVRRWVAMTDMANEEAVAYLQTRLESAGVEKALAEAGASPGDEVRIGGIMFEWWPFGSDPGRR